MIGQIICRTEVQKSQKQAYKRQDAEYGLWKAEKMVFKLYGNRSRNSYWLLNNISWHHYYHDIERGLKSIKSATWSEYLSQFFDHIISENPLFLHIQQGTESSFAGCVLDVYLLHERWSGRESFVFVPIFRVVFPLTHANMNIAESCLLRKSF